MFQNCLICTDFTDSLERLILCVDSLAESGFKEVTFLHNVPLWEEGQVPRIDNEKIEDAKQKMSPVINYAGDTIKVNTEITSGVVVDNIIKTIKKYNVDCVITGTPVRSSLQERIFGSTTMALASKIKVPIMILRPQLISVYTMAELRLRCQNLNRYWLVPCYKLENTRYLVNQIKEFAQNKPTGIAHKYLFLIVIDDVSRSDILIENSLKETEKKATLVKQELESLGLEVEVIIKTGNPLQETLKMALKEDITAVAIADEQDTNVLEWTVKSFAGEVLHKSWFPVVFFPFGKVS